MNKCQCGNTKLDTYSKMYYKCQDCGTLVSKHDFNNSIYSVKDEANDLYGSNYWQEVMTREANVDSLDELIDMYIPERASYWLKRILQHIDLDGNIAEVGCGLGQLSYLLKLSGFEVFDFELSPGICEVLEKKLGLSTIKGELSDNYGRFNTIIAMDVFEHLTEPRVFLDNCKKCLGDGLLILQTPCYDPNLTFEQMKQEKPNFEHLLVEEQHVFLYSRASIEKLLKEYGFTNVEFEPAFFGDDYDMFLFASHKPIQNNDNKSINLKLYRSEAGRAVKGLIDLRQEYQNLKSQEKRISNDREKVLEDLLTVTNMVHQYEKSNNMLSTAANERLELINRLSGENEQFRKEIASLEEYNNTLTEEKNIIQQLIDNVNVIRIGVNLTSLFPGKIGGAEQYVRNVIKEMGKMEYVKLFVFVNENAYDSFLPSDNIVIIKTVSNMSVDSQLIQNIDQNNIEIMFCPLFFVAPHNSPVPVVVSILDIQHEFYPQYFEKDILAEIRKNTAETINRADGILTISEFSKRTMVDTLGVDARRIRVTYLNSDSVFEEEINADRKRKLENELGNDFIFYPANSWPHKNHLNLLKAYKILKEKHGIHNKLLFSGDSKQKKDEISEYIKQNYLQEDVIYLGYREQKDMPCIFSLASILVFPSLFEGFGIPLVEAMRANTPIACSSCGSIPEVAQDAALYFDAEKPEDIAEKIYTLLSDNKLREDLISKGTELSKEYSWKRCAEDTVKYLRTIASKPDFTVCEEEMPLVTIVTPSYNQGGFIKETIDSVLSQDYPNIEYIVMDGGSTDNTLDVLRSYGDRIIWKSEKDKGQGDAVNKGIRMAKGTIIGWLNSDDTYLEGAISKIVDYLVNRPSIGMVYGDAYYTGKDGEIIDNYPTMVFDRDTLASNCFICQPAAFFRKQTAVDAGLIDIKYQCSMDYEFWMRMERVTRISYYPVFLATSRLYEENKTLSRRDVVFRECFDAVKKHYGYVPISWCRGFADYKANGKRNLRFYCGEVWYFVSNNASNKRYLRSNLDTIYHQKIKRVLKKTSNKTEIFTKQYEDGWIGRQFMQIVEVDEPSKFVQISGTKCWPLKHPLIISVLIDGNTIGKIKITDNGAFTNRIYVSRDEIQPGKHEICIKSNKTFCPAKWNESNDMRELSFVLTNIMIGEVG